MTWRLAARWVVGLSLLGAGCGPDQLAPPMPPITYQAVTKPLAAELPPVATEQDVPVPEDFDEASEQEITGQNFRAELDRIEAEINADRGE